MVYGKAALGFGAIRAEIGDEAFFAALKDYSLAFRFEVATPADLRAAFERAPGATSASSGATGSRRPRAGRTTTPPIWPSSSATSTGRGASHAPCR